MIRTTVIVTALILIAAALWIVNARVAQAPTGGGYACPRDAMLCPDGSYIARSGPYCEFAACPTVTTTSIPSGGGTGITPYTSGVRGTVSLGPTCPVQRIPPDPVCADRPYTTSVTVYRPGSKTPFATANSTADGAFSFSLPPGSYTLTAGAGEMLPRCAETNATVPPNGYVIANISCDTGIR